MAALAELPEATRYGPRQRGNNAGQGFMSSIVAINDLDHDFHSRLLLPPGPTVAYILLDFLDAYFSPCFWSRKGITHLSRSTWALGTLNRTASRQKTQVQGTDCRLPLFFLVYHHWNTEKLRRSLILVCLILLEDPIISIMPGFIASVNPGNDLSKAWEASPFSSRSLPMSPFRPVFELPRTRNKAPSAPSSPAISTVQVRDKSIWKRFLRFLLIKSGT